MFFKASFSNSIDESLLENFDLDYNSILNKEVILFRNHEFEVERNEQGFISEITYCNQCVATYDIEEVFIELLQNLLDENDTVILSDSDGLEEELTKDELLNL